MNIFPDCFPDNFESEILPQDTEDKPTAVYRVIKNGIVNKESFYSTCEEVERGIRPPHPNDDCSDAGYFSTSCFIKKKDADKITKMLMRHKPDVKLAFGKTNPKLGLHQLTLKRVSRSDSHLDWWLFKDANPDTEFEVIE